MKVNHRKIPIEMAIFALREHKYKPVCSYVASLFIYDGKARSNERPARRIANQTGISESTVYRHFKYLLDRNWMGKDEVKDWFFFRGLDYVHKLEKWKYSRAAVMLPKDLQHFKAFLIGAVLSSIVKTGKGTGTDRVCKRSEQSRFPISLSLIQQVLDVSRKTAFTYRKVAKKAKYITMIPNLHQVTGLSAKDVILLKQNNIERVKVNLFGTTKSIEVKPQQLRTDHGYIYAQLANLINPQILIKNRQ